MTGADFIARGANRVCMRDPDDPHACLKYELPAAERTVVGLRERARRWLGQRFPRFGENATELRAWRRLRRRLGAGALAGRFAAVHGRVDTPRGAALRCELVALADGSPAPSLYWLLFGDGSPLQRLPPGERALELERLAGAVDAFTAWLKAHDVPLFDLNAGNFVVLPGPRLVCVDAKSVMAGKELVPYSRWSRRLMHRKIDRRAARLKARVRGAAGQGIW